MYNRTTYTACTTVDSPTGAPWCATQSLFADDGTPWHVPQRLLTVVLAPFDWVEAVIGANDILMRLFGKGWVQLVVIDPHTGKALRWATDAETSQTSETPITEPENQP